jgi:hypothetical protein
MANETTVTSITETIYAEWISPYFQSHASHYSNPSQFAAGWNPTNGASTIAVPRWVSDLGTPVDRGAAVDTEFDATEATALSNLELETTESTFAVTEYAIQREVSYTAVEDTIAGDLLGYILADAARILSTAANSTMTGQFSSLSTGSGATTVDLALADLDDALYDLAERGVQGSLVGVLDHEQVRNFFTAVQASAANTTVYSAAADRVMAVSADGSQGRNDDGLSFSYKGVPFYRSGLCLTANAAADVVGAIFVRGDLEQNRPMATWGQASRRPFMLETEKDVSKRTVRFVGSMRWGCGITQDTSGQKIVTDAP